MITKLRFRVGSNQECSVIDGNDVLTLLSICTPEELKIVTVEVTQHYEWPVVKDEVIRFRVERVEEDES
jgi:hypothetical protein